MDQAVVNGEEAAHGLSSLSSRGAGASHALAGSRPARYEDVTSQRLIELASRITGDAVAASHEPAPHSPAQGTGGVNGHELSARDRLAERIAALAAADAPGTHAIVTTHAPQPLANSLPAAPPPPLAPATPRLADLILGQQATLQGETPPHMARVAADAAPHIAPSSPDRLEAIPLPIFPSAVDIGRMAAAVAAADPIPAVPPHQPMDQVQAMPPPTPAQGSGALPPPSVLPPSGESWRERLLADGLPGFLAGIFVALAIGIALYILLRRL